MKNSNIYFNKTPFCLIVLFSLASCFTTPVNKSFLNHINDLYAGMPVEQAISLLGKPDSQSNIGNRTNYFTYQSHPYGGVDLPDGEIFYSLHLTILDNKLVEAVLRKSEDNYSYPDEVLFNDERTQMRAAGHSDETIDHSMEMGRLDKLYRSGKISRQEMIKRATAINKKYYSVE